MNSAYRVLLADDDTLVLNGFRETLGRSGYDVTAVDSGQAAVELLDTQSFDVVMTDLLMPSVNGLDVLRAALTKNPESVVVIVTGFATVRSAVEALRLGAYDYVVKPCEDKELLYRVRMGIERVQLQRELRLKELDTEKMKAIAQTAVTVNDQINTPLNVILNSAEYIRLKTLPDSGEIRQSLDFISQEVVKIKSVIQKLARIADPRTKEYAGNTAYMVDVESSGQRDPNAATDHGGKRRILVVDDEHFMVHALSKLLDMMGYDVVAAFGGKEAYEVYLSQSVDLVVSDLHMPDMSGLDLLTSIKTHNPQMPVILVTGFGIERAAESARCKADGFLGKPFKIGELKSLIDQALNVTAFSNSEIASPAFAQARKGVA